MRRTSPVLLVILGIVVIFLFWGCSQYNGIVTAENKVDKSWSDVNAQYQRKKNLYDNVVASIKGSARNEDTTLIKITQMRSRIPNSIDANNPQALNQANQQLDQMKGTILNINFENYPNLQTTQQFREFQNQIDRTEGRVANAIRDWSSTVQEYNQKVITFPGSVFASMFGKHKKTYFSADEGAKDTKVDFGG
jgi:LemA protein